MSSEINGFSGIVFYYSLSYVSILFYKKRFNIFDRIWLYGDIICGALDAVQNAINKIVIEEFYSAKNSHKSWQKSMISSRKTEKYGYRLHKTVMAWTSKKQILCFKRETAEDATK